MFRVFGHYLRTSTLLLGVLECGLIAAVFHLDALVLQALMEGALISQEVLPLIAVSAGLLWLCMYAFGVYEPSAHYDYLLMGQRMVPAGLFAAAGLFAIHYYYVGSTLPTAYPFLLAASGVAVTMANRALLRSGVVSVSFKPQVLVLGTGQRANNLRLAFQSRSSHNTVLHGFLQLERTPETLTNPVPRQYIVEAGGSISEYARRHNIAEVVVALDDRRGVLPMGELFECRLHGIRVLDSSSFFEREAKKVDLDNLYPSWLIFADGFRISRLGDLIKRAFDIAVSSVFLIIVFPVLLVTMIAIKLDSEGPVFYHQTRVGRNGRTFEVLKFRSMTVNAEADGQPQWARAQDQRITRVGHFIRKVRIDEVPQVLNVLKGDMSFVGPRPERPAFVEQLSEVIPYYRDRHRVKPGITGWAQINYPYGASIDDAREKLKYDLYYMKNHSLLLDLIIILKTARVVVASEGAR